MSMFRALFNCCKSRPQHIYEESEPSTTEQPPSEVRDLEAVQPDQNRAETSTEEHADESRHGLTCPTSVLAKSVSELPMAQRAKFTKMFDAICKDAGVDPGDGAKISFEDFAAINSVDVDDVNDFFSQFGKDKEDSTMDFLDYLLWMVDAEHALDSNCPGMISPMVETQSDGCSVTSTQSFKIWSPTGAHPTPPSENSTADGSTESTVSIASTAYFKPLTPTAPASPSTVSAQSESCSVSSSIPARSNSSSSTKAASTVFTPKSAATAQSHVSEQLVSLMFDEYDKDGDGKLSWEELLEGARSDGLTHIVELVECMLGEAKVGPKDLLDYGKFKLVAGKQIDGGSTATTLNTPSSTTSEAASAKQHKVSWALQLAAVIETLTSPVAFRANAPRTSSVQENGAPDLGGHAIVTAPPITSSHTSVQPPLATGLPNTVHSSATSERSGDLTFEEASSSWDTDPGSDASIADATAPDISTAEATTLSCASSESKAGSPNSLNTASEPDRTVASDSSGRTKTAESAGDSLKSYRFNKELLEIMFEEYGQDGDGNLSWEDLSTSLASDGLVVASNLVAAMIKEGTVGAREVVNFEEFSTVLSKEEFARNDPSWLEGYE